MTQWLPSAPVDIEEVGLADVDALADLHADAFHRGWSAEEMEGLMSASGVFVLAARRRPMFGPRHLVGFVLVRVAADEAEILTLAVDPRYRRRGIGRRLMETALRRLYGEHVRAAFLEVEEDNVPALRLYHRLRFRTVATRQGYYTSGGGPPSTALVMQAHLR